MTIYLLMTVCHFVLSTTPVLCLLKLVTSAICNLLKDLNSQQKSVKVIYPFCHKNALFSMIASIVASPGTWRMNAQLVGEPEPLFLHLSPYFTSIVL